MFRTLFCAFCLLTTASSSASVLLSITPAAQTITATGSQATVEVDISGLGNGTALGVYDLAVTFDPSLLSYSSVLFGDQLDVFGLGDIQNASPGVGTLELFELSLDSPSDLITRQKSSFRLATLTFGVLGISGSSPMTVSVSALGDAYGNSIAAAVQGGSVNIGTSPPPPPTSAVPEPSSLLLVFSAFMGGALAKRKA